MGNGLPRSISYASRVADNRRQSYLGRQILEFLLVAIDECRPFQEVLRKIPAQAKFGKYGKVGAALFGLRCQAQNARRIPRKIADGGIELSESDSHAALLEYEAPPPIANGSVKP